MPTATQIDAPLLMMEEVLTDILTGCDETEAVLTWAGDALLFSVNDEGRLSWRLTNRDGSDPAIPQKAAVGIFDHSDALVDTLPVCLEPGNTTNPLLWADKQWDTGGPYQARLTVQFTDGTYAAAMPVELAVRDINGWASGSGGGNGSGGHPGTVWSVGLDMPPGEFNVANSPITDSGVITVTSLAQSAGKVWAGPEEGADAAPAFRSLVLSDLPPTDPTNTGNYLIEGGEVVWVTGYTYRVSAASYYIQGVQYASAEASITLDAADPILNRIDLIALNTEGTVVKITGVPSATPFVPDYDPGTQLSLGFEIVFAASSAPTVTSESIYAENAEWATSTSLTGWTPNSTNNPRTGSLCVEGTNVTAGAYVQFSRPGGVGVGIDVRTNYSLLVLYIRSKAPWAAGRFLMARFQMDGVAKGIAIPIKDGSFGFGSGTTFGYQQIGIPISSFLIPAGTLVNQLRIGDNGGPLGCYIDDVFLQHGGLQPNTTQYLTVAEADLRYEQFLRKGAANGYAPLDASAKVPLANLPPLGGAGTVTSVDINMPAGEWTVTGNPVTGAGTLIVTKNSQAQHSVYAAPSASAGAPTFRALVATDIPALTQYEQTANKGAASGYASLDASTKVPTAQLPAMGASGASHAAGLVPDPGAVAGTTRFLREDGSWSSMATGAANMVNGQVAASGTAGTLVAARATRRYVTVKNLDSTITVYVGVATVTAANGVPLLAGESISLDFTGLIQVIAASGTPSVAYAEVYD